MLLRIIVSLLLFSSPQFLAPVRVLNRKSISEIQLTAIGKFGLVRKERKGVRSHLHTGIDIKRPGTGYDHEPVFPVAEGTVISIRTDGPYAQVIIEHKINGEKFWSLYEHIAGVCVKLQQHTDPQKPIARFMNNKELNRYGWQFDHFHLEILKIKPLSVKPDKLHPDRYYGSYTLICYEQGDLEKYYYEPLGFLKDHLR
ncbi:MAG: M23 family metallopeptidase [Bacteroidia bacterium]